MKSVSSEQARKFLKTHLHTEPQDLEFIGEGAWSSCFGYQIDSQEFAIRFGRYADDFYKDRWMAKNALKDLPIIETKGLVTDFFLERNDPREILISKDKKKIERIRF